MENRRRWGVLGLALLLLVCLRPAVRRAEVPADGPATLQQQVKYAALTFDDGPREGTTDRLLDGLKARGVSATFFLVGEQAEKFPELVRRIQAEGHQVGNHTWSHVKLQNADRATIRREINRNEELLSELLGGSHYWLRPPYGMPDSSMAQWISVPMIKWSVDPRDWESRDREAVVQAVLPEVKPNSIILLHDIYPSTVDAALEVADALQEQGYWLVTVEELFRLNGVEPRAGVTYCDGTNQGRA